MPDISSELVRWRGQLWPTCRIIDMRVRRKNTSYQRWRDKWAFKQLDGFCTEALMRFGEQPYIKILVPFGVFNRSYPPFVDAEHKLIRWRREFRVWAVEVGVANNITEAAQFRKFYDSWHSYMSKGIKNATD